MRRGEKQHVVTAVMQIQISKKKIQIEKQHFSTIPGLVQDSCVTSHVENHQMGFFNCFLFNMHKLPQTSCVRLLCGEVSSEAN